MTNQFYEMQIKAPDQCLCLDCAECYHVNANAPDQSDF